ncbi:MAG: TOMM precursor leader peptide-binding protein [Gammaproteobacteria bacterium]|nr:TOMM precursor leader peptide-binding protein [Gammaproteobacteria bacterium]
MSDLSNAKSTPSILKKKHDLDQGLITLPVLTPHLQYRRLEQDQILLVSESFNTLLHGQLYWDLIPALDGSRTLNELTNALHEVHGMPNILTAIVDLSNKGYIVSAEHTLAKSSAAYWSSMGASPCWVEQRFLTMPLEVDGDLEVTRLVKEMGARMCTKNPKLKVVITDDMFAKTHSETNRQHLPSRLPWMLVRPEGIVPLISPVFLSEHQSPCWTCFSFRLQIHDEVHGFLRNIGGEELSFKPFAQDRTVRRSILGLTTQEILKWILFGDQATLHQHAISVDLGRLDWTTHRVLRRPQCIDCGDQERYGSRRKPKDLKLQPSPKLMQNSGGTRSATPEQTLAKYLHLVSPISGVVSWLSRTSQESDSWLHVHWAGSNFGMRSRSLASLRRSFRSKSAGKGSTRADSKVSALCEAIERYSGSLQGSEIVIKRRFTDLLTDNLAIHPNEVQLFSEHQLDNASEINKQGHPYNVVPSRFDPDVEIDWTPVWSFTQDRHRYLPTSMLYSMPTELRGSNDLIGDSNGCAAGNTLEEATLQGLFELVERDSFAIWWYNKLRVPAVDLTSFDDRYLEAAPEYYTRQQRDFWMLDVTADLQIPTFVALSKRRDGNPEEIIYGAGAHQDPKIAAMRALCELNQCLSWVVRSNGVKGPRIDDPIALNWLNTAQVDNHTWLKPAENAVPSRASDFPTHDTKDIRDDLEHFFTKIHAKGMEILVLDQTRPDIGMPVVRVLVPGLRHFWARLAPGRLYDVPVTTGRLTQRLSESELNTTMVIV